MYQCTVQADSLSPLGYRLTTLEITFPRLVLAEFNTHRMFSRNSASSRAIPVIKQLRRMLEDPFIPVYWGVNRPGMQATEELPPEQQVQAEAIWLEDMYDNMYHALELQFGRYGLGGVIRVVLGITGTYQANRMWADLHGRNDAKRDLLTKILNYWSQQPDALKADSALAVHKQIANRLLEPHMWHTVIVTATEWDNFFALRTDAPAQPEIRSIAEMMYVAYEESEPRQLGFDDWHLPYVSQEEMEEHGLHIGTAVQLSTGRCARVSYLTHDGTRDPDKDIELHNQLGFNGHVSPYEHPARPMKRDEMPVVTPIHDRITESDLEKIAHRGGDGRWRLDWSGNFRGFVQYRKTIPHEDNFAFIRAKRDS